jgi:hypothetical protein
VLRVDPHEAVDLLLDGVEARIRHRSAG